MTDPFSVTAGTAGFISLGLEVCKGLIDYCRAWKSHDSEIEEDLARLSHLELTFENLQDILLIIESIDDSTSKTIQAARGHIRSCTTPLNKLYWTLVESEPISQPSGILDKVHNVRIRSVHLFSKEKLTSLRGAVAVSQSGLSSAIQLLSLHLNAEMRLALKFVTANSKEQTDQIPNTVETAVIRQFELYGRQYSTLRKDMQDASSQQNQALQLLDQKISGLQPSIAQSPSLIRSVHEECRLRSSKTNSKPRPFQRCICRPSTAHIPPNALRWRRRSAARTSGCLDAAIFGGAVVHQRDCPFFGQFDVEKQFGMRLSYSGPLLARALLISMSMTRGSGGFSMSPTLAFSPTVPSHAPAFKALECLIFSKSTSAFDMEAKFEFTKQELSRLYRDGKASPYDLDEYGNTVLHMACNVFNHNSIMQLDSNKFHLCFQFLKGLYDLGVPLNSTNARGLTPLQDLVQLYDYIRMYDHGKDCSYQGRLVTLLNLKMVDLGAEVSLCTQKTMPHLHLHFKAHTLIEELAEFPDLAEAFDCNEVMQAVLAKSQPALLSAIGRDPASVHQRNGIGQLPLHLCVDWPEGVRLLLLNSDADVDGLDATGYSAITYAMDRGRVDTIKILAEADCSFYQRETRSGIPEGYPILGRAFLNETPHRSEKSDDSAAAVVDTIISLLAKRRRVLTALARTSLDAKSLEKLELSNENILDHKISLAVSMLSEKIQVPNSLKAPPSYCTVYHLENLNRRQAQCLWDAGFRDVDEFDEYGHSPLMRMVIDRNKDLELVEWFVSRGAELHRKQAYAFTIDDQEYPRPTHTARMMYQMDATKRETSHVTAAHYLAHSLGWLDQGHEAPRLSVLNEKTRKITTMILGDPLSDCCVCACSVGGCHPYTMLVKLFLGYRRRPDIFWARNLALQNTEAVADLLDVDQPSLKWLRREILQFNTFEKLRLRHTCCSTSYMYLPWERLQVLVELGDEEDRHEIREEQAETVQKLEELLIHFERKYDEMAIPFIDFLKGYWKDHMKRVRSQRDPINAAKLESIGVTVHATDYASTDASDDEDRMEELDSDDSGA